MDNKELFKKIGGIISELRDQHTYLTDNPESLNEFELELFRANATFLCDHIDILRKLNQSVAHRSVTVAAETRVAPPEEEKIAEEKPEAIIEPEADLTELPVDEIPVEVSVPEPVDELQTISAKQPEELTPTVNDILSAGITNQNTLGSQLHKPLDLKSSISLNDKLLFVKDLFSGYSLAYNEAIDLLNRFDNFESANTFLQVNYAVKNKWDEKQATVDKFYEVLRKRY